MTISLHDPQAAGPDLLFAYGTLRRVYERHRELERLGARYMGRGSIGGELFDLGLFPGARKPASQGTRVVGEVYRLPRPWEALPVLDRIEGFRADSPESSLFVRETAEVGLRGGQRVRAWVYWLNRWHGAMRRISSGDYRRGY